MIHYLVLFEAFVFRRVLKLYHCFSQEITRKISLLRIFVSSILTMDQLYLKISLSLLNLGRKQQSLEAAGLGKIIFCVYVFLKCFFSKLITNKSSLLYHVQFHFTFIMIIFAFLRLLSIMVWSRSEISICKISHIFVLFCSLITNLVFINIFHEF